MFRVSLAALGVLLLLASSCRERHPDTPGLDKARALSGAVSASKAGGSVRRVGKAPDGFDKHLTGGKVVFEDDFDRKTPGENYKAETKRWRMVDGQIINKHADNKGFWLLKPLPKGNVRIEFDVRSDSFEKKQQDGSKKEVFPGDLKCEAFNMTPDHQTGYVFIFGGWNNRTNRIARLEEHGDGDGAWVADGPTGNPVEAGHTYRMKIVRVGKTMAWYADDKYLTHMEDPQLIEGQHFGFNNWRSHLTFDNLAVVKLP
jgi:hypothetical protein